MQGPLTALHIFISCADTFIHPQEKTWSSYPPLFARFLVCAHTIHYHDRAVVWFNTFSLRVIPYLCCCCILWSHSSSLCICISEGAENLPGYLCRELSVCDIPKESIASCWLSFQAVTMISPQLSSTLYKKEKKRMRLNLPVDLRSDVTLPSVIA